MFKGWMTNYGKLNLKTVFIRGIKASKKVFKVLFSGCTNSMFTS